MNTAGRSLAPASGASLLALLASLALACASDRGSAARQAPPANEPRMPDPGTSSLGTSAGGVGATPVEIEPPVLVEGAAEPTEAKLASAGDARPAAPHPAPHPWEGAASITSNAGTYRILYRTTPPAIPRGESFAIEAWVFAAAEPDRPLEGLRLSADAAMPEHGHGMNRVPRIEQLADGGFRVEGMYFHMPGLWQLYLDVTRGALTERAQLDADLE